MTLPGFVDAEVEVKTWWRNDVRFSDQERRERWQCSLSDRKPLITAQGHDTEEEALAAITAALKTYQRP